MPSSKIHLLPVHPRRLAVYFEHAAGTRLPGTLHLHDEFGLALASIAAGTDLARPVFVNLERFSAVVRASLGSGPALASVTMPPESAGSPAEWTGEVPPIKPLSFSHSQLAASRRPTA
jgi:hypothetical protein